MSLSGFQTPWWFLLLLAVAAIVAGYVWVQRRRRQRTLRFANLELLEKAGARSQGPIRHVPAALLAVASILLIVALAGPTAEQKVPRNRAVVVLAVDVSLSMNATDVEPNRLEAAKKSASSFVNGLTKGVNLGLVTFAGTTSVLVPPTTERPPVAGEIGKLKLAQGTATGEAIYTSLDTIKGFTSLISGAQGPPPARIVLMSDGKQVVPSSDLNGPRGAFTAAKKAKDAKVPISTISFGTEDGSVKIDGEDYNVPVDDDAMEQIATLSGGNFYKASTAGQLQKVYDSLGEQIGYETRQADASRPWLMIGALAVIVAAGASLVVNQRLP